MFGLVFGVGVLCFVIWLLRVGVVYVLLLCVVRVVCVVYCLLGVGL